MLSEILYEKEQKSKTKVKRNQRTEGPESCTDGETLIFWD